MVAKMGMKYPYRVISGYAWYRDSTGIEYQIMRKWLINNVGPAYEYWQSELVDDRFAVNFVREHDAMLFALRWA